MFTSSALGLYIQNSSHDSESFGLYGIALVSHAEDLGSIPDLPFSYLFMNEKGKLYYCPAVCLTVFKERSLNSQVDG